MLFFLAKKITLNITGHEVPSFQSDNSDMINNNHNLLHGGFSAR